MIQLSSKHVFTADNFNLNKWIDVWRRGWKNKLMNFRLHLEKKRKDPFTLLVTRELRKCSQKNPSSGENIFRLSTLHSYISNK
jgi:hypothetical protein